MTKYENKNNKNNKLNDDLEKMKKNMSKLLNKILEKLINEKLDNLSTKQNYINLNYSDDTINIKMSKLSIDELIILATLFIISIEENYHVEHYNFEEVYKCMNKMKKEVI